MGAAERTKNRIAEGLKKMMEDMPVDKITIQQIVEASSITRPTFYRYFQDKYDLINWYFEQTASKSFRLMGDRVDLREALILKFTLMREQGPFYSSAFRSQAQNNLIEYDYQSIYHFYREFITSHTGKTVSNDLDFVLRFYCIGSIYMTAEWAKSGMVREPEEITEDLIQALPPALAEIFPIET